MKKLLSIVTLFLFLLPQVIQANFCPSVCNCIGYSGIGGACYSGIGGPAYDGIGGPAYDGIGGPCYDGIGGPCYDGIGGGKNCPRVCSQCN